MTLIYHITTVQEAERAARAGQYLPTNFEADGFIHCSYSDQLRSVAESKFRGRADLALLEIDSAHVDCPPIEVKAAFPHIHGPLPMKVIRTIRHISVPDSGSFDLPGNAGV